VSSPPTPGKTALQVVPGTTSVVPNSPASAQTHEGAYRLGVVIPGELSGCFRVLKMEDI
jgi:hypothetical protein